MGAAQLQGIGMDKNRISNLASAVNSEPEPPCTRDGKCCHFENCRDNKEACILFAQYVGLMRKPIKKYRARNPRSPNRDIYDRIFKYDTEE